MGIKLLTFILVGNNKDCYHLFSKCLQTKRVDIYTATTFLDNSV